MSYSGPLSIARTSAEEDAERLPAAARAKFLRLRVDLPSVKQSIRNSLAERRAEKRAEVLSIDRQMNRLTEGTVARERRQDLEKNLSDLRRDRDRARAAEERLTSELQPAIEELADTTALAAVLQEGISAARVIKLAKPVDPPRGWTEQTARAERISVLGKLAETEGASADPATLKQAVVDALDARAARADVRINFSQRTGDPAGLAKHLTLGLHGSSLIGDGGTDFLIWALRDIIEERLLELIPDELPGSLTDAQRDKRLSELRTELLRIERIEEALIEQAEAEGRTVLRRPDADFRAVLGIEVEIEAR